MFLCFCDGGKFRDQVVAVCGGGNRGNRSSVFGEAGVKVIIIELLPELNANALLLQRVRRTQDRGKMWDKGGGNCW